MQIDFIGLTYITGVILLQVAENCTNYGTLEGIVTVHSTCVAPLNAREMTIMSKVFVILFELLIAN